MARRRKIVGTSLLTASATLVLASCGGGAVSGNLVAPPMVELCVTATPDTAAVTVDGTAPGETGCLDVFEGTHAVAATADGYVDFEEQVEVLEDTDYDIVMVAETATP